MNQHLSSEARSRFTPAMSGRFLTCLMAISLAACGDGRDVNRSAAGGSTGNFEPESAGQTGAGQGSEPAGSGGEAARADGGAGSENPSHVDDGGSSHGGRGGTSPIGDAGTPPTGDGGTPPLGDGGTPGTQLLTLPVAKQTIEEDGSTVMALSGFDATNQVPFEELSIVVDSPPRHGTLSTGRGKNPLGTQYTPSADFNGSDRFRFVVVDSDGRRSEGREVTIDVVPMNDAPRANDDTASTDSLTEVHIDVTENDTDVDDVDLSVIAVTQPLNGSVTIDPLDDAVRFMPRHPDSGRVSFEYTVRDSSGAEDTALVEIDVTEADSVRITSFTVTSTTISAGESVEVEWTAVNGTDCSLNAGADIASATSGSVLLTPDISTRYTLTCRGPGGPVTESVTVVVTGLSTPDSDGDGIPDAVETITNTDRFDADSDDDGVPDGIEDENHDGSAGEGETDPRLPASKDARFCDGLRSDNDGDGIHPQSDCSGPMLVAADSIALNPDGKTWATAFRNPQDGVDAALAGQDVWIQEGGYRPPSANAVVLSLRDGAMVYGGFLGTETYRAERDESSRRTILDGDFAGDDVDLPALDAINSSGNPAARRSDNSFHVVYGAAAARLDGFTIRNGHASDGGPFPGGGGLLALYPRLTIANTSFVKNSTPSAGGAIRCADRCDLTIERTDFVDNHAANGGAIQASPALTEGPRFLTLKDSAFAGNSALQNGGALDIRGGIAVAFTGLVCSGNTATTFGGCWFNLDSSIVAEVMTFEHNVASEGGAIYSWRSQLNLGRVTFASNGADFLGGGLLNHQGNATVTGSIFSKNTAQYGGSISNHRATLTLEETLIAESTALESGGGIQSSPSSNVTLSEVTLEKNGARFGGGIVCEGTQLAVTNSELGSNQASVSGGAAYLFAASSAHFEDVTLLDNFAATYGGALYVRDASYSVRDSVFNVNTTTNTGAGIYQWTNGSAVLERVAFVRNTASYGVGTMVFGPGSLDAEEVVFVGNKGVAGAGLQLDAQSHAAGVEVFVRDASFWRNEGASGTAVLALFGADPTIVNATFAQNEATDYGAALAAHNALSTLVNVAFWSNIARWGGAVASNGSSRIRLSHASFLDNRAELGGGIYTQSTASSILLNSVLWGSAGSGPDVYDLGSTSQNDHVGAAQMLAGPGNSILPGDPFELVQPGARLYLNRNPSAGSSALNAGAATIADDPDVGFAALGLAAWSELTTAADGQLDSDPVDLGRHYDPNQAAILGFEASASRISWRTVFADRCAVFNDADATSSFVEADRLPDGSESHGYASNTEFTLVCFGPQGEPSVAFASVPE
jgi:predicted outer membrane repeat protein